MLKSTTKPSEPTSQSRNECKHLTTHWVKKTAERVPRSGSQTSSEATPFHGPICKSCQSHTRSRPYWRAQGKIPPQEPTASCRERWTLKCELISGQNTPDSQSTLPCLVSHVSLRLLSHPENPPMSTNDEMNPRIPLPLGTSART